MGAWGQQNEVSGDTRVQEKADNFTSESEMGSP